MTVLDLCAYLGLAAVRTATLNLLLGLLLALRYSPMRMWPHHRINIFRLHNWTAYLVLLLIILHPVVLLFRASTRFGWPRRGGPRSSKLPLRLRPPKRSESAHRSPSRSRARR